MAKFRHKLRTVLLMALVIGLAWFSVAKADLNEGLVAYYPFDGNANDKSGNGNDGTVHGATLIEDRFDNADSAYNFSGNGNSIIVPNSPTLNPVTSTLSVWVKISYDAPGGMDIVSKDGESSERQYLISRANFFTMSKTEDFIMNDGNFRAHVGDSDGKFSFSDGQTLPVLDQWYHVAQTSDGNSLKLYVNGQYESPSNIGSVDGGTTNSSQPLRIGGGAPSGTSPYWFIGVIDDIRIYNRALSEAEIKQLYQIDEPNPPTDCDQSVINQAIEKGKQICIDNPASCGIIVSDGSVAPNTSNDCMANYSPNGQLHVPCVSVPDLFGGITIYDIKMQQHIGVFTFDLDMGSVKPR